MTSTLHSDLFLYALVYQTCCSVLAVLLIQAVLTFWIMQQIHSLCCFCLHEPTSFCMLRILLHVVYNQEESLSCSFNTIHSWCCSHYEIDVYALNTYGPVMFFSLSMCVYTHTSWYLFPDKHVKTFLGNVWLLINC